MGERDREGRVRMLDLPDRIVVVEVAPRDGLQSLPMRIDTDTKVRMIDRLSETGFPVIEVTGFAHPAKIPNLADAEEVCARIARRPGTIYRGLVPNARGAKRAAPCRLDELVGLLIVSPKYLAKNQNMDIDKSVEQAVEAFRIADAAGQRFVAALGMAMWCPYVGVIPDEDVIMLVDRLRNAGIRDFYLAGSVGMEDPRHVGRLFSALGKRFPDSAFGFHVHNLSGFAPANILAALDAGAAWIESAVCGVGGGIAMPAGIGKIGNFPTEDLVIFLEEMGVRTGLDPASVLDCARDVAAMLAIPMESCSGQGSTRAAVLAWGRGAGGSTNSAVA
jgi:hydroxymethylglutaryl-CoA lyase